MNAARRSEGILRLLPVSLGWNYFVDRSGRALANCIANFASDIQNTEYKEMPSS